MVGKQNIKFGEKSINKMKFLTSKKVYKNVSDIDVNKIVLSTKKDNGDGYKKYFVGYEEGDDIHPIRIVLPKLMCHVNDYGRFLFKLNQSEKHINIRKKYDDIWGKVEELLGKDIEDIFYKDNLKIKPNHKTNYNGKQRVKKGDSCEGRSIIYLESVWEKDDKYYPSTLLHELRYEKIKVNESLLGKSESENEEEDEE